MFKEERIKDGDYVYGPDIQGVYYVRVNGKTSLSESQWPRAALFVLERSIPRPFSPKAS
jgi:hypothetical protein